MASGNVPGATPFWKRATGADVANQSGRRFCGLRGIGSRRANLLAIKVQAVDLYLDRYRHLMTGSEEAARLFDVYLVEAAEERACAVVLALESATSGVSPCVSSPHSGCPCL
jgi:hypothetical protein